MTAAAPGWYRVDDRMDRWWSGRDWTPYTRPRVVRQHSVWFWMAVLPPLWPVFILVAVVRIAFGPRRYW